LSAKTAYDHNLQNWSDIQGHLPLLFEAAHGFCLEIGTRSGCSTSALLAGIEEHGGHLWSVDINDCQVFKGHPNWTFIQADSSKNAPDIKNVLPESLDVLFVDGDHTYEVALRDLYNFGPMAKRIFVHDVDAENYPGVRKAVEEYATKESRNVTWHSGSFGMAEL
jgi:predicted O-methyltransferase YrrM